MMRSFQICMSVFLQQNAKEDTLKNVNNQTTQNVFHRRKTRIQIFNHAGENKWVFFGGALGPVWMLKSAGVSDAPIMFSNSSLRVYRVIRLRRLSYHLKGKFHFPHEFQNQIDFEWKAKQVVNIHNYTSTINSAVRHHKSWKQRRPRPLVVPVVFYHFISSRMLLTINSKILGNETRCVRANDFIRSEPGIRKHTVITTDVFSFLF